MTDGGDLVELFAGAEKVDHEAPVRDREEELTGYCSHQRVELDSKARRVYCRDCEVEVPAFDYLRTLSSEFERYIGARKSAVALTESAKERLRDLERREGNCKGRLRTARRNLAALHPTLKALEELFRRQQHYVSREQILAILDNGPPTSGR